MSHPSLLAPRYTLHHVAIGVLVLLEYLQSVMLAFGSHAVSLGVGATPQQFSLAAACYAAVAVLMILGHRWWVQRLGYRRMLRWSLLAFGGGAVLCALASSAEAFVAARMVQALGGAAFFTASRVQIMHYRGPQRLQAMLFLPGGIMLGSGLAPIVAALLLQVAGWQALFLVLVPLGGVTLLLLQRHLPASGQTARHAGGHDPLGTLLLALSLGCYALAMTSGHGSWSQTNSLLLALALLGGGLFLRSQQRAAAPLIRLSLLRQPPLLASLLMSGMVAAVVMATLVVGPFYLSRALALSNTQLGLVMSAGPLVAAFGGVPSGRLVDRYGAGRMVLLGLLAMLAGSSGLAMLPLSMGSSGYLLAIVTLTAGYALFQGANNTGVMHGVAPEQRGLISGLLNLARNLGLIAGASVMGWVFAWVTTEPAAASPATLLHGVQVTFGAAAGLLVLSMFVGRTPRPAASGL